MSSFDQRVADIQEWMESPRFQGITRLYSASQIVTQQGTIPNDYPIAREAATAFYARLRELFEAHKSITTFGPYSPGQACAMKRMGIEGIYLGGWATSAKGSTDEDPGPDLGQLPAQSGAQRSCCAGPCPVDGRSQSDVLAEADDSTRTRQPRQGVRFPTLHHRRRRHRPWW